LKVAKWWNEKEQGIECYLCPRRCIIADQCYGVCNVRKNVDNTLYTIVYGNPIAVHVDPIEKKPLYHFYPGAQIFSVGTVGCNLLCEFCQNWDVARAKPDDTRMHNISPEKIIDMAQKSNCIGIAFTYNEPTIFGEYVLDIATLAHQSGLQTVMVTNGYITPEAIDDIYPFIDAANIDLKSFSNEFYRQYCKGELQPVLDALQRIRDLGTFVEITTLIIPDKNDSDSELDHLTRWIVDNLGQDVPVHFSAFHPDYKMRQLTRTPKETLDKARKIATRNGLRYVYEGNVLAENEDNTYCYHCGRLLIERRNFSIIKNKLEGGICSCGSKIAVVQS